MDTDPKTLDEYNKKSAANQKIEGQGLGNVFVHMPCPFCAEPDFMTYEVLDVEVRSKEGAVCKHCKRGMKAVFKRSQSGVEFEFVQTEGEDPPSYLPKMRRDGGTSQ